MTDLSFSLRNRLLPLLLCTAMAAGVVPSTAASLLQRTAAAPHATPADAPSSRAAIAAATDDIVRVAGDHRLLLIGELHGTREMPQLAAALVARYSTTQPVVLALELARNGDAAIATYLDSQGRAADRQALRAAPFLKAPNGRNDGRRNESVLDMIETLRRLRGAGRDVAILPFDVAVSDKGAEARDRAMAAHLRASFDALPRGRLIVVTGNVHAMKARPDFPDAAKFQTPMGKRLRDLDPYSINVGATAGHYRVCMKQCQEQPAFSFAERSGPASGAFRNSYDYQIVLPAISPAELIVQTPMH